MNQVTSTLNRFDIRCVESPYEPENTNVLWVTRDEFGRINSIKQFWNGAWTVDEANSKLDKINKTVRVAKVKGSYDSTSGTITCKSSDYSYLPTGDTECRYATKNSNGKFEWSNGLIKKGSTGGNTEYWIAFLPSTVKIPEDKIIDFVDTL